MSKDVAAMRPCFMCYCCVPTVGSDTGFSSNYSRQMTRVVQEMWRIVQREDALPLNPETGTEYPARHPSVADNALAIDCYSCCDWLAVRGGAM